MSFRQFGGLNYAARHNIVSSNYNTSNNLLVTQNVGQPNSYINFLSDISGNIRVYGDFDLTGNLHVGGNIDVSGNIFANEYYITGPVVNVPNSVVPKSYVDSITLAKVLATGNSAGTTDIDMNNQNILNVYNMNVTTINGIPYPPPSSVNFTLTTITTSTATPVTITGDVKYIVVTLTGGGGGAGKDSTSGLSTTFTLNGVQVLTAAGGSKNDNGGSNPAGSWTPIGYSAPNNSGAGGMSTQAVYNSAGLFVQGLAGQTISAGYNVTSGDTYQVTIGAGGVNSGGGTGGSGIAYITMYS